MCWGELQAWRRSAEIVMEGCPSSHPWDSMGVSGRATEQEGP
jgi:hypothetical protein